MKIGGLLGAGVLVQLLIVTSPYYCVMAFAILPRILFSEERKILSAAGSRALGPESARQTQLTVKFPSIALV